MTTTEANSATEASLTVPHLTWGWLFRRSVLLVFILAATITSACWLYAAASPDGAENHDATKPVVASGRG